MSTIGERIKKRRLALGLSVDQVAKQLGKDRATVYRYESDEIGNMPLSIIEPLARILGVSPAYIMGWESIEESFEVKKIPVLGKIAAGEPILACEEHCEYVVLNHDVNVDFCLRVKGDSMVNARIQDGDLVFIKKQPTVENGEIAAVLIDDEVTLKRVYITDEGIILKPENSAYQPKFYTEKDFKDIRILGKAVLFQSKL